MIKLFYRKKNKKNLLQNANNLAENNATNAENVCDFDVNETEMAKYNWSKINPKNPEVKSQNIKLYARRLFFIFLSALIFNFGVLAFLTKADTIPSGVSGIPTIIIFLVKKAEPFFAIMYLVANIPLFILFGVKFTKVKWTFGKNKQHNIYFFKTSFKVKKSFILLTLAFMLFQIVTNIVFTQIPGVKEFISESFNVAPGWTPHIKLVLSDKTTVLVENPTTWPIFINGSIGSFFLGIAIAIAWKNGGSTGGTDLIAYYFSTKKKKSIASILMVVSFITTATFLVIFGILNPHLPAITINDLKNVDKNNIDLIYKQAAGYKTILGMREISTILYILIVNTLVGFIYPKYKKVSLEISCSNPNKVITYLKAIKYWHAYTIYNAKSGYTNQEVYKIETTMLLLETKSIIRDLKRIDNSLWIKIKPVSNIFGSFSTSFVD
ncbi:YitT family protein [Mycoplasmopsis iners]|uniref:YitT family protein n=1 Tax=Mycoplasmopsis iners TaxID=76630 RepID=UPI0004961980|nr:YitT family protein [Mycoplasmopsis iners]